MNSSSRSRLALIFGCGGLALSAFATGAPPLSGPSLSASTKETASSPTAENPETAPALTRAEALKKIAAAHQYVAHPSPPPPAGKIAEPQVMMPAFEMDTPPPAPRTETKPAAPAAGQVWVPGHYMPVEHQWRWVRGEWAVPATPISVWIPARYDEKEKKWTPGYWQPDAPAQTVTEAPKKDDAAPARPSGY